MNSCCLFQRRLGRRFRCCPHSVFVHAAFSFGEEFGAGREAPAWSLAADPCLWPPMLAYCAADLCFTTSVTTVAATAPFATQHTFILVETRLMLRVVSEAGDFRNTRNLFFWQLRPSSDYCIALNADMLTDITFFCLLKTFWTTKYKCCLTAFSIYLHNCSVGFIMLNGICEFSFPLMPNYVHMLLMLCKVRKRPIKDNYHKPNYKTKQHSFIHYLNKHIALRSSFIAIIVLLLLQSITTHMLWKLFLETTRASSS